MKFDKTPFVVKHDKWDAQVWDDVLFDIEQVRVNQDEIWEKHNFVNDGFTDFFMSLYQGLPLNNESRDILEDHMFNDLIVNEFQEWTEVEELRVSTKFHEYEAAFAMVQLHEPIKKLYEDNQAMMDLMEQLSELLKQLSETGDPGEAGQIVKQIEGLQQQARELGKEIQIEFRQAVKNASDELAKDNALMRTFGLEEGQLQRMDFQERYKLSQNLKTSRMLQFANLIGQFKLVAKGAKRSKVTEIPDEVIGAELGDDMARLAVESMIAMSTPELELKFWNGYFNHELVQKKVVGPHPLGKGDVVFVMDESGSMSESAYGGTREQWGKALAITLLGICRKQKRTFTYIGFSGQQATRKHVFKKGYTNHTEMLAMIEGFFGGGTYPFTALFEAIDIVNASPSNNRPDVIFLTDGDFGEPAKQYDKGRDFWTEWQACKNRTGMQSFGITFDGEPRAMKDVVDTVLNLDSMMANPEKMTDIMRAIQE